MLAVTAARTRMHSSPSRKTGTADIERGDGGGGVRLQRIGRTMGCDSLPDENRDDKKRGEQQARADTDSPQNPIFPRGPRDYI